MRNVLRAAAALLLAMGGFGGACTCSPEIDSLDGLACEDGNRCADGYTCDRGSEICVKNVECADEDGDGWCVASDCNDAFAACTSDCVDADGDGVPVCAGDCDDSKPNCKSANCEDIDSDGYCAPEDCDDSDVNCNTDCVDADSDGMPACAGDCDDANPNCTALVCVDSDGDTFCDAQDCAPTNENCNIGGCVDGDGDTYCAPADCDDTIPACTTSCLDADGDGTTACAGDCDDAKPNCILTCTDVDQDGFCEDSDCNDFAALCSDQCGTDGDFDMVDDCLEVECGTDPAVGTDTCVVIDGAALNFANAMSAANGNAGKEKMLVTVATVTIGTTVLIESADNACIELRGSALFEVASGQSALDINDDGCIIDGLRFQGGRNVIDLSGDDSFILDNEFDSHTDRAAVRVTGDNNLVAGNFIHDGIIGVGADKGGILIDNADGNQIVDNVVVDNASDGIRLNNGADDTVIDHNTLAGNEAGIRWSGGTDFLNLCMRNNIIADNNSFGLEVDRPISFDLTTCPQLLTPTTHWGNAANNNPDGDCGGGDCGACSCVPSGANVFWEFTGDPLFVSADPNYCLSTSSPLVNSADDLGYDLTSPDDGADFVGVGPDVGAQETGAGVCQ